MPRPEKVQAVAEIRERIEAAQAVFVTEFRGMTVKQMASLRRGLRDTGADYKVVKMSLARRAADDLGIQGLVEHLVGPSGLTFAGTDAVATAKVLRDAGKDNENLVVKVGFLQGGALLLPEEVSKLADIESREVLLAKIAGAAKAPLFKMAGMFGSFTRDAASLFSQLLEKKESGSVPAGEATAEEPVTIAAPADEPVEASTGGDDIEEAPAGTAEEE
jgi:large subunit ribosomal protein L10